MLPLKERQAARDLRAKYPGASKSDILSGNAARDDTETEGGKAKPARGKKGGKKAADDANKADAGTGPQAGNGGGAGGGDNWQGNQGGGNS